MCPALSVSIGHSHSISQHKPRKSSTCATLLQAFIAKARIACDHWCLYIERHRALLCILLTHVWKPAYSLSYTPLFVCMLTVYHFHLATWKKFIIYVQYEYIYLIYISYIIYVHIYYMYYTCMCATYIVTYIAYVSYMYNITYIYIYAA